VLIIAQDNAGRTLTEFDLAHGSDPVGGVSERGFRVLRPVEAVRDGEELLIKFLAETDSVSRQSRQLIAGRDGVASAEVVRQRVAAYAWVESRRGILASEFHRPVQGGRWGLPGGGIDPGEEPRAAVHREVLEETGQRIVLGELVDVNTRHWIGSNADGVTEDFHAVRLIYRAECPDPTDPQVLEIDGTTSDAAWFPLHSWQDAPWMSHWREMLIDLFG
jgi:8-oxo-dGTP diphosphatase